MATFLEDLKTYFEGHGYTNIWLDQIPDKPDPAIGLFVWAHTGPAISDGSAARYVQVQVRNKDLLAAYRTASEMFPLVDSGPDEDRIWLTDERWGICRIRLRPQKLSDNTYYFEFSFFGEDIP